jgi:hypothetical protein
MRPEAPLQWHDQAVVTKTLQRVYKILRGNISYGSLTVGDKNQNLDGYPVKNFAIVAAINTEFAVSHGLNRVPVGFHVVTKSGAGDVYQSTTAWTSTQIFLKCTTTGINVSLFIF